MEKNRGSKIIAIVALVVAVFGLTLGFAAFSNTLVISSSATVTPSSDTFKVNFSSSDTALETNNITGVATVGTPTVGEAKISGTTISDLTAGFTEPGQTVTYTFYARNTGDYNAKVQTTLAPTVTCTYEDTTSAQAFCTSHVRYGIYKDANCTTAVTANDPLAAGGYAQYWVKVELLDNFAQDGADLPTQQIIVTAPAVSVIYEQDGNAVTTP